MKKFIALALGLSFIVSGIFLFGTEAHIYSRHAWRSGSQQNIRPYSNRVGSYKAPIITRHRLLYHNLRFTHPSMRANTDRHSAYRPATVTYRDQKLLRRIQSPELYPRYMNELQSKVNIVRAGNYKEVKGLPFSPEQNVYVYNPKRDVNKQETERVKDKFQEKLEKYRLQASETKNSIRTPQGFQKISGVYRSKYTSLAFRITEDAQESCHYSNVEMCAVNYRKGFVDAQNLSLNSEVKRIVWPRQTVQNDFAHFPVVTESFYATVFGMENVYFLMTAFNPSDGSMVHVEGVANVKDAYKSAETMEKVFESFRFQM